jgi:hypothetical protein
MMKKEALDSNDLNGLRKMMEGFVSRTGHRFSRQDVNALAKAGAQSDAYYYELAMSMLLSWDAGHYYTTKKFDTLYPQMKADGGRKPTYLAHDLERIRLAARHAPSESDEGGIPYKLDRDGIVQNMSQIKISMDNSDKIIAVLNEFVK